MKKQQTIETTWIGENKKASFWILSVFSFLVVIECYIIISGDHTEDLYTKEFILPNLEFVFIPFTAINAIYFFKKRFKRYTNTPFQFLLLKVTGLIIGVMVGTGIMEYTASMVGYLDDDYITLGDFTISPVVSNFITNIITALMIGIPVFSKELLKEKVEVSLQEKEKELDKLYQLKIKSELDAIHAKINPHFLYNSLNSIVSLIHEDPDKAEKMVLSLSDLFRYSINSKEEDFSTIQDEMYLVRTYLEIEHVRFQDRLKFDIVVDKALEHVSIPKFLIQPLIENAIKHGIPNVEKGIIKLEITQLANDLCISVFDNGIDFPEELNSGYGLKSTVDKLDLLYKDDYSFQILNTPEKRIKIILKNIF